jgi:uncharacterized protein YukE
MADNYVPYEAIADVAQYLPKESAALIEKITSDAKQCSEGILGEWKADTAETFKPCLDAITKCIAETTPLLDDAAQCCAEAGTTWQETDASAAKCFAL